MLQLTLPKGVVFDEKSNKVIEFKNPVTIELEHSLRSISLWESKYKKPFLTNKAKTVDETIDYIKMMVLDGLYDDRQLLLLTDNDVVKIREYLEDPMTATTIHHEDSKGKSREQVTSELIYYWMISLNIPFECQDWHIKRLLTLIDVCSVKNAPPKKHSQSELYNRNRSLNAARRKKYNTRG